MDANEKRFRYTYIFKNLAILYLIFLALIIVIAIISEAYFLAIPMTVLGIILATFYLNTSVYISDEGITTKTLVRTKSLMWSEISNVSLERSLLKLYNHSGDIILTIDPRLDKYAEVVKIIDSKRIVSPEIDNNNHLSRNALTEGFEKTFRYEFSMIFLFSLISFTTLSLLSAYFLHFSFFSFLGQSVSTSAVVFFIGLLLISLIIFSNTGVVISDQDIVVKSLWGWKLLEWHEIKSISRQGQSLKLHNHDGNVILLIHSQLMEFVDAVDLIRNRRPDLFDSNGEVL